MENAPKEMLDRSGVKLVIIGNGSPAMAKAYRSMCNYHDAKHNRPDHIYLQIMSSDVLILYM